MKTLLIGTLSATALALSATSAAAAEVGYSFTVTVDSGGLTGQSYSGSFSYDDAQVPVASPFGGDLFALSSFSFAFVGGPFGAGDLDYANAVIDGGLFTGLELGDATYSFLPASGPFAASFAYDLGGGNAGNGSIVFTPRVAQIPEPGTAALLALGMMAAGAWRRRQRPGA